MIGSAYSEVLARLESSGPEVLSQAVESVPDKDVLLLDAAYALDEAIVGAALSCGANPSAKSFSIGGQGAETPLHRAVRGRGTGSFEAVVRLLIDAGTDIRARNAARDTPLHAAMYENEDRAITLVRLGLNPSDLDDASQPIFIKAILLNMMTLAELLLDKGVPIDCRDLQGQTALLVATREGRISAVKFLLERGADPNAADLKRYSPKRVALESGDAHLEMLFVPPGTAAVQLGSTKRPTLGCSFLGAVFILLLVARVSHLIWG